MIAALLPCPFCGHEHPEFERMGDRRQSCIVICGWCGARHESSDEGHQNGASWNSRATPPSAATPEPSDAERLDWLEQVGTATIQRMRRMDPKAPKYWDIEFGNDEDTASGPNLRAAIDAAIRATKGGK